MLEDLSLGAALWKKASFEISDALIHITMPLLNADDLDYSDFAPLLKLWELLRWEWLKEKQGAVKTTARRPLPPPLPSPSALLQQQED